MENESDSALGPDRVSLGSSHSLRERVILVSGELDRFRSKFAEELQHDVGRWLDRAKAALRSDNSGDSEFCSLENEFIRLCVQGRMQPLLEALAISFPAYNYLESYEQNLEGPWQISPSGSIISGDAIWNRPSWKVLGFDLGFPIGIPASVLTVNSKWIHYYAQRGFNIFTYKTVRSHAFPTHHPPNWLFARQLDSPLSETETELPRVIIDERSWPKDPRAFSMVNSFGVSSFAPDVWQQDVAETLGLLAPWQLLIVSVMGSSEKYQDEDLVSDFVRVARLAEEAGARAIELNLSCPNRVKPDTGLVEDTLLCESVDDAIRVTHKVRDGLSNDETRLVVKLGQMEREDLRTLIQEIAPDIDGVAGINTISVEACDQSGNPGFVGTVDHPDSHRKKAGLSGIAIQAKAQRFLADVLSVKREQGVELDVLAMGGVMTADDVDRRLQAGAAAVQVATIAFFDPEFCFDVARTLQLDQASRVTTSREERTIPENPQHLRNPDQLQLAGVESARG